MNKKNRVEEKITEKIEIVQEIEHTKICLHLGHTLPDFWFVLFLYNRHFSMSYHGAQTFAEIYILKCSVFCNHTDNGISA